MAPRRNPKSGSPGPGGKRETKHGGSKNGKKEGISGSSFFTWFMVIALLGVWTSVAVVWFELVDYEEVLAKAKDFRYNLSEVLQGKLGIYDADGDGDFDVDDAKILLGLKERSVPEQPTKRDAEEEIRTVNLPHAKAEPEHAEAEPEDDMDEIESLLHEVLKSQFGETSEDSINHDTHFRDEEENNEIFEDTVEAHTLEDYYEEELDYKMPEIIETPEVPESFQEEPTSDYQPGQPEQDETHVSYEYHSNVNEDTHEPETHEPEGTDYRELTLEDALEHNTEPLPEVTEPQDYVEEHDLENEVLIETWDIDGEPLTEHYYGNVQAEADASDSVTEHIESDEREQAKAHVNEQPRETEVPVQAEDYSNDNLVDT